MHHLHGWPIILLIFLILCAALCFLPVGTSPSTTLPTQLHTFPSSFYWGASTAAYQIEGGNSNDWTVWEQANASRLAATAEQRYSGLPDWPAIKSEASDPNNYIAGEADDSYNRYPEDIALAKSLNLNSYRFSIEWSRIEPEKGKFDQTAITYYRNLLADLHKQNIEPFVTLWHFTLPTWVADQGGWSNSQTIDWFNDYVRTVVGTFKSDVHYWITLNEPEVYANNAYLTGSWTPNQHNLFTYVKVTNTLIEAHKQAYDIIKGINPTAQVGIAKNDTIYQPYKNRLINVLTTTFLNWWGNEYILNQIGNKQDFIGLNYYIDHAINFFHPISTGAPVSDLGWELHPEGLYENLKNLAAYKKPIYITEEGLADASDTQRASYMHESIAAIQKAMDEGVDVRGYLPWSLLDNFEWAEGFWPRFGLIAVDRKTLARTIRPSGEAYATLIKQLTP